MVFGWILSIVLALVFLGAGGMKLASSKTALLRNKNMAWAADFPESRIKAIGGLEVLGGLGVLLPWLTGIARVLTPLAALGLAAVMVGAVVVHNRRGERAALPVNAVLLLLAVVVAVVRFAQL